MGKGESGGEGDEVGVEETKIKKRKMTWKRNFMKDQKEKGKEKEKEKGNGGSEYIGRAPPWMGIWPGNRKIKN